jgi:hypothetical protein
MRDPVPDERGPFQALFEHQRRAESAVVPPFAATMAAGRLAQRRRRAHRGLWLYATASAAALVVVAAVMLRGWFTTTPVIAWSAPLGVELSAVSWTAPTDFLLATPDAQALGGVPRLLRVSDLTPAPTAPANDTND